MTEEEAEKKLSKAVRLHEMGALDDDEFNDIKNQCLIAMGMRRSAAASPVASPVVKPTDSSNSSVKNANAHSPSNVARKTQNQSSFFGLIGGLAIVLAPFMTWLTVQPIDDKITRSSSYGASSLGRLANELPEGMSGFQMVVSPMESFTILGGAMYLLPIIGCFYILRAIDRDWSFEGSDFHIAIPVVTGIGAWLKKEDLQELLSQYHVDAYFSVNFAFGFYVLIGGLVLTFFDPF